MSGEFFFQIFKISAADISGRRSADQRHGDFHIFSIKSEQVLNAFFPAAASA